MSDPNAPSSTTTNTTPGSGETSSGGTAPGGDWRDQRRAERHARRGAMRDQWGGIPIGGLVILVVGVIFLAGNFGLHLPPRWWALFVLVPAAGALVSAARFYRLDGNLSTRVVGAATGGVLMLAIALALFLGLNWGMFWPVILIIVGAGIITRGYWPR